MTEDKSSCINNENCYLSPSAEKIKIIIHDFINNSNIQKVTIIDSNINTLFELFKREFANRTAAGGLVCRNHSFLAIKRFGLWDLPKGHTEKGEDISFTAVREVEEECGISSPVITNTLTPTYHIYELNGDYILKTTYWYMMLYTGDECLQPQTDEDITEAVWLDFSKKGLFLSNTYSSLKEIVDNNIPT